MMRRRALMLLGAAALGAPVAARARRAGAAGAAGYDGRYAGVITCDVLPGQTSQTLKTKFSMTIADGRATYEREVLRPNNTLRAGITERGTGTVSASGDVALTGAAAGQGWSYDSDYRGRFDGKRLRLSGAQQWRLPSKAQHSRPCTVTVSRAE
jgi:hypothetical protein